MNSYHKWLKNEETRCIYKNDYQIIFLLIESESREGGKWIPACNPSNSNSKKVKVSLHCYLILSTSSHIILVYAPWVFIFNHLWYEFVCIQSLCVLIQTNRSSMRMTKFNVLHLGLHFNNSWDEYVKQD